MFRFGETQYGVLDATRDAGKHKLTIRARQIKLGRDGVVSALVAMIVDTTPVHSDIIKVDDAGARHTFANDLYGTARREGWFSSEITHAFPQHDFEHEFMLWSRTLWPAFIGASSGGYECGDEKPSAPHWSVPGLVLAGLTGIWYGAAGANKSTLMRLVAVALEHGKSGLIPVRGVEPVIWVNAEEDPREHTRQLGNVNAVLGVERTARMYTIHARGMHVEDLAQRLEKAIRETGAQHIFVDSLSRLSRGMNLNENATANLLMDTLGGLGPSVNWIGHTGQENEHRLAGSKHFENAARLMVRVQSRVSFGGVSSDLTRGVRTSVWKANGAPKTDPMFWTFDYHREYGLMKATPADSASWPVLQCEAMSGEGKSQRTCGRKTWDGVTRNGVVLCSRHRGEEAEE